ncbi:hypothetical protein [Sphingobacterium pedocola]|nr:hypothetical protein [Sphingobacterium pedocola]
MEYKTIDSIDFTYYNKKTTDLIVYGDLDSSNFSNLKHNKRKHYYNLEFEGDLLYLQRKYPLLYDFILNENLKEYIPKDLNHFGLVVSEESSRVRDVVAYYSSTAKLKKTQEFTDYLNAKYSDTIMPTKDSILIVQAVLDAEGTIKEKFLLHGEEGRFYEFVFGPDEKHEKYMIFFRFFNSYRKISIADIYVRLNPDRTFSVSSTGRGRVLRIKNYKEDPKNPLMYW